MKNYLRHNFRSPIVFGRSRISVVGYHPQDINYSPLRSIFSACICEKNQIHTAAVKETNEKEKKKSGWLNNLLLNDNDANPLKGALLGNEYAPFNHSCPAFNLGSPLKKQFSGCNVFISYKNEDHKSAKNIGLCDSIHCEDPTKKHELSNKVNFVVPIVADSSNNKDSKGFRSRSNPYLRNNVIALSNEVSDNSSRNFTKLRNKSEYFKNITSEQPKFPYNLQHSDDGNGVLLDDSKPVGSTVIKRDPTLGNEQSKKDDSNKISSFSSVSKYSASVEQPNEKDMKKCNGLDSFIWNQNQNNVEERNSLENAPFKHINFLNISCSRCKKENQKSVENISTCDSFNCVPSSKKLNSTNELHSFIPTTNKCSNSTPYFSWNKSGSQCNCYLRSNFLKPCNDVSNISSRSFATLCTRSKFSKTILFGSQHSGNKVNIRQIMSKTTENDPGIFTKKLKKRDLDWINSFSSEAVILQPSRGEFSIKKLINKTTCQERQWGLPHKQSFAKTTAPRVSDNLVQYMALKQRMESEFKKNYFDGEGMGASQKVKMLIKSAEEKNRQMELKKMKSHSTKSKGKTMLRTIKESMNLKPIDILKIKEKTAKNDETRFLKKTHKKRSILNFRLPNFKVNDKKDLLQNDNPPATEYQSSASYKHVFQEIFNKADRSKLSPKPAIPLSVFNRQASHNFSRSISKLSSDDSLRNKNVLKRTEKRSTLPGLNSTINLKHQARSPFQKPSNTQLTSKSIASFSTVSKFTKTPTASCPNLLQTPSNKESSQKTKSSERSICTHRKVNEEIQPVIKKSLYSTLGYIPVIPKRMDMKPKKKFRNIQNKSNGSNKNKTKQEYKSHIRPANSNSGYFSQRRSLSSFGVLIGNMMEGNGSLNALNEPSNEQIFKEVMNLCKGQPATEKKASNSETEKKIKNYDRCSVQEKKKPERRRGFVCRLASMLNIGCGRRRRINQGCTECGKKAS